jgi:eukaryotic translation initiation factor 2C
MDPHEDELPPPPPLPPNVVPIRAEDAAPPPPPPDKPPKPKKLLMARPGLGKKGQPIQLLANHYKVSVKSSEDFFHHYDVTTA